MNVSLGMGKSNGTVGARNVHVDLLWPGSLQMAHLGGARNVGGVVGGEWRCGAGGGCGPFGTGREN